MSPSGGAALRVLGVLSVLLLTAAPAGAVAGPERPALHWVRGAGAHGCIDPRSLAQRVEDITGPAFVPAAQADVSIEARIESSRPGTFTLFMRLIARTAAESGERIQTFDTSQCRTLDASIAFLIATAIDPSLGTVPVELSWVDETDTAANADSLRRDLAAEPHTTSVSPAANTRADATPQAEHARSPSELGPRLWQLGLAAIGGNGSDAHFAAGLGLELAHALTSRITLAAQLTGESATSPRALPSDRTVLTQRTAALLLACWQLPLAPANELRTCAGPELGLLLAYGRGFEVNRTSVLATAGALARIELRRELGAAWMISGGVALHAVALRPRIYYERADSKLEAFRASPWLLQLSIGVVYKL